MRLIFISLIPILLCSCSADVLPAQYIPSIRMAQFEPRMPTRIAELSDGAIHLVETSPPAIVIRDSTPIKPKYVTKKVIVTAYCPCARCCGQMTGRTSNGSNAWKPGIAVAPEAIPYGTIIHVPGYDRTELAVADDTGAAMRRAWRRGEIQIDVRMTYHWEARQWGRQELEIKIYN